MKVKVNKKLIKMENGLGQDAYKNIFPSHRQAVKAIKNIKEQYLDKQLESEGFFK